MADAETVLTKLGTFRMKKLQAWVRDFIRFGRSEPECPWPGITLDSSRLIRLLSHKSRHLTGEGRDPHNETVFALREAIEDVCGLYAAAPASYSEKVGLELERLVGGLRLRNGALALGKALATGQVENRRHRGVRIDDRMMRTIGSVLADWADLKRTVNTVCDNSETTELVTAALEVWARLAPAPDLKDLPKRIEQSIASISDESPSVSVVEIIKSRTREEDRCTFLDGLGDLLGEATAYLLRWVIIFQQLEWSEALNLLKNFEPTIEVYSLANVAEYKYGV